MRNFVAVKTQEIMKKSTRIAGIVFLLLSLADVIVLTFHITEVHSILKPLLIPALAVAALCALLPEHRGMKTALLAAGLALHTAGDTLLLWDGAVFFAAGMGAFLLGHICYLVILLSGMDLLRSFKNITLWLLPVVVAFVAVSFLEVEWPLRISLMVYAVTLLSVPTCGGLWLLSGRKLGWLILSGGMLFVLSDSLLALKAFNGLDFSLHHAIVMCTYLVAELLLVGGMVSHLLHDKPEQR